jgi:hypothetical protein
MKETGLREHLERLHAELAHARTLAPSDRVLAERLAHDLQAILAERDPQPVRYQSLRDRLRESMERLEAAHPKLSAAMEQAIDQLAQLNL